jgi:hypothetical protein
MQESMTNRARLWKRGPYSSKPLPEQELAPAVAPGSAFKAVAFSESARSRPPDFPLIFLHDEPARRHDRPATRLDAERSLPLQCRIRLGSTFEPWGTFCRANPGYNDYNIGTSPQSVPMRDARRRDFRIVHRSDAVGDHFSMDLVDMLTLTEKGIESP